MTKKIFEALELKVVRFDEEDIVRTSETQSGDVVDGPMNWDD